MISTRRSARCASWATRANSSASTCRTRRLVSLMQRGAGDAAHCPRRWQQRNARSRSTSTEPARDFDLPLAPDGTTFQLRVWEELRRISYAETISYGELARRIGKPTASRAVGAANGRNPLAIVVPCHRVIGADGTLTGYGGGLPVKKALLALERRIAGKALSPQH